MGLIATLTGFRLLRFLVRAMVLVIAVLVVYLVVTGVQVWLTSRQYLPRPSDAIVVMGSAQYNGIPSPDLAARLDEAELLWKQRWARTIMVTGYKQPGDLFTRRRPRPGTWRTPVSRRRTSWRQVGSTRGRTCRGPLPNCWPAGTKRC